MNQPLPFSLKVFPVFILILLGYTLPAHAQMWDLTNKLGSSDQEPGDNLGISVAISGSYMITGAWWQEEEDHNDPTFTASGSAYIYKLQPNGSWEEIQKLVSPYREPLGYFGFSVAIDGDYALVGAFNEDHSGAGNAGRVYAYHRNANDHWILDDSLLLSNPNNGDYFGTSIAIAGEFALVGADRYPYDENGANFLNEAGAAFLFKRQSNNHYTQIRTFVAPDRAEGDNFGKYVDLDQQGLVIAAPFKNMGIGEFEVGAAYAFSCNQPVCDFDNATIANLKKVRAPDQNSYENFGWDVAISGNWLVAGKSRESDQPGGGSGSNTGAAYFFLWENNQWVGKQKVYAPDFSSGAKFGRSIGMDGPVCVIGAGGESDDANGQNFVSGAGAAYVFELQPNNQWLAVEKLVGTYRGIGDLFGEDAADVSGTHVVVGAWLADTLSTTQVTDGGAVYVFERDMPLTAVNEYNTASGISILSNPSTDGMLRIRSVNDVPNPLSLQVFSLDGICVFRADRIFGEDYNVNLSHLAGGIYFVQINPIGDWPQTVKWIKL